ncbi:unnamed protein product [Peronospora destructor]|uniref:Uncharacterized protein n=1 Tax=Peronospora destructor TaxID=86335 RepID=A0AAV0V5Q1_9STRA|nr:unnamed protein product [Peronospora destructor]
MTATVESFFPALSAQAKRSKKRSSTIESRTVTRLRRPASQSTANAHRLRKPGLGLTLSEDAEKCIVVAKELGIDNALFTASAPWRKISSKTQLDHVGIALSES